MRGGIVVSRNDSVPSIRVNHPRSRRVIKWGVIATMRWMDKGRYHTTWAGGGRNNKQRL